MARDFYADASFEPGAPLLGDDLLLLTVGETLSGKTALVNALEYPLTTLGTWLGSTVPRVAVDADMLGRRVRVLDMHGTHGTSVREIEELVRLDGSQNKYHVAILCVMNADAFAHTLPFIVELTELGVPLLLGLRDYANAKNKGTLLNLDVISRILGVPILTDIGERVLKLEEIAAKALETEPPSFTVRYNKAVEDSVREVARELNANTSRWLSISSVQGLQVTIPDSAQIKATQQNLNWRDSGSDFGEIVGAARLQLANGILREIGRHSGEASALEQKLDKVLTAPFLGVLIILALAGLLLHLAFSLASPWTVWINSIASIAASFLAGIGMPDMVQSLVNRCFVEGLGSFLAFIPLVFAFFLVISGLEESGLSSRLGAGFRGICSLLGIADIFSTPLVQSLACTVHGIETALLMPSPSNRIRAALALPFVPCAGRLAVLACLSAILCPDKAGWVLVSLYAAGMALACLVLLASKCLELRAAEGAEAKQESSLDLPPFRFPKLKSLICTAGLLTWNFFATAFAPVILVLVAVWALVYFKKMEALAGFFAWAFSPLGLGDWRAIATMLSSLVAKEAALAAAAMNYLVSDPCQAMTLAECAKALGQTTMTALHDTWQALVGFFSWGALHGCANMVPVKLAGKITPLFKPAQALALLVFTAFSTPCLPTLFAVARQARGKYMLAQAAIQLAAAWVLAFMASKMV